MADENNDIVQTDEDYMKINGKELREKEGKNNIKGIEAALWNMHLIFGCCYGQKLLLAICNSFNLLEKKGKLKCS